MKSRRSGTVTGLELAGYYSSGEATLGQFLMATGDGNCVWVDIPGFMLTLDGGAPADDETLIADDGIPSETYSPGFDGGTV